MTKPTKEQFEDALATLVIYAAKQEARASAGKAMAADGPVAVSMAEETIRAYIASLEAKVVDGVSAELIDQQQALLEENTRLKAEVKRKDEFSNNALQHAHECEYELSKCGFKSHALILARSSIGEVVDSLKAALAPQKVGE